MPGIAKKSKEKNKRKSALDAFRVDYERHDLWSYAEAGDFAGVSPYTIKLWAEQGMFPLSPLGTPYRVIAAPFKAFLITGEPSAVPGQIHSTV